MFKLTILCIHYFSEEKSKKTFLSFSLFRFATILNKARELTHTPHLKKRWTHSDDCQQNFLILIQSTSHKIVLWMILLWHVKIWARYISLKVQFNENIGSDIFSCLFYSLNLCHLFLFFLLQTCLPFLKLPNLPVNFLNFLCNTQSCTPQTIEIIPCLSHNFLMLFLARWADS